MFKMEYFIVKFLYFLFPLFSFSAMEKFANFIAFILRVFFRFRTKVVKKNLDLAYNGRYPQPYDQLLKHIYRNFVYIWFELLQGKKINAGNFDHHFKTHNIDILDDALKQNRGVVLVMGHLGSFEWTMPFFGLQGYNLTVLMKRLKNPYVNDLVVQIRERFGCKTVYTRKAPREGFKLLKKGGVLEIIGDQYAGDRGVNVQFLGQQSSTAVGAAVFQIKSQAPMVFAAMIRSRYGYFDVYFENIELAVYQNKSEESIKEVTQAHTRVLEKWIRKYPAQWYWVHKRWKKKKN